MIAYFDCFGGISGDMTLGALLDAGAEFAVLEAAIEALGLSGEADVTRTREQRGHLGGTRVAVRTRAGPPRTFPQLTAAVEAATLPAAVRDRSLQALECIAVAESAIHDQAVEDLHLHELGGADTLVDVVGAFALLDSLAVERVYASPLPAPRGSLGPMPLPAPASLRILAGTGAVLEPSDAGRELVTPTGAAILAAAATFTRPSLVLDRVGYGFGANPAPGNALAVWIGAEPAAEAAVDVLETNLDDMAPNDLAALAADLMEAGALDVTVTPTVMKKGRPGHVLAVMSALDATARLTELLLARSTTLGLRVSRTARVTAAREVIEVDSELGRARVKVKRFGGRTEVAAEHDDLRRLAKETDRDLREVRLAVETAARAKLGMR